MSKLQSRALRARGDKSTKFISGLDPYGEDAGTDSGTTYTSPDQGTVPRGVVSQFTGFPAIQDGMIVPFGTFTFPRLD